MGIRDDRDPGIGHLAFATVTPKSSELSGVVETFSSRA